MITEEVRISYDPVTVTSRTTLDYRWTSLDDPPRGRLGIHLELYSLAGAASPAMLYEAAERVVRFGVIDVNEAGSDQTGVATPNGA